MMIPALLLALLAQDPRPLPPAYSEVERGPNWIPATFQFGAYGTEKGKFVEPRAVAVGRENRVYVADTGNHRIQVFSIEGKLVGGWGGPGSEASQFLFPSGIAVSSAGEVFVADTGNHRIQVFDGQGMYLREIGRPGVGPEEFSAPAALAATKTQLLVAEADQARVQVFTLAGQFVRTIGGLRRATGVAGDDQGNVFVADGGAHRIARVDAKGETAAQWGQWGTPPALLASPAGLAWFDGRLFVADAANHRIQVFDRNGAYLYQWGRHPAFAHEGNGRLHGPWSIAVSPSGGYAVLCEPLEHRVQVFAIGAARAPRTFTDLPWWDALHARFHVAPKFTEPKGTRPTALTARLDPETHSVLFFDVEPRVPVFVGRIGIYGTRLGEFGDPAGLAADPSTGRFYVSERSNRRVQLLDLPRDPKTGTGFTAVPRAVAAWDLEPLLAGAGDGILPQRCSPGGIAVDADGRVYVVDEGNSAVLVFDRQMKLVRTILAPDRPSRFVDVAVAPGGKAVYVLDRFASKVRVFDAGGKALASWGTRAELPLPAGIAAGADGSLFVTDAGTHQILKFDPTGKLLLKWGSFGREASQFYSPRGISVVKADRVVVDDPGNHRGHVFTSTGEVVELFHMGGYAAPVAPTK